MQAIADNTNGLANMVSIRSRLVQTILLKANTMNNDQLELTNTVANDEKIIALPMGSAMPRPETLSFNIVNKFLKDGSGKSMVQPTVRGSLITCTYMLHVYINFEGCCVAGPEIKFPIALYAPEF